jgi:hypothetical protein
VGRQIDGKGWLSDDPLKVEMSYVEDKKLLTELLNSTNVT